MPYIPLGSFPDSTATGDTRMVNWADLRSIMWWDATVDYIGHRTKRFMAPWGDKTHPGYAFETKDPTTTVESGFFMVNAAAVGLSALGTQIMQFGSNDVRVGGAFAGRASMSISPTYPPQPTPGLPYGFYDDGGTGMGWLGSGIVGLFANDIEVWRSTDALSTNVLPLRLPAGSAAATALQLADAGDGFFQKAADQIGVAVAGAEVGYFAAGGWVGDADTVDGFEGADLVAVAGDTMTGNLLLDNTADLYFKTEGAGIKSDSGSLMMGVTNSGLSYDNNLDYLPNWVAQTAANITTGIVNNSYTSALTITIFDHVGTNRSVRVTAHGQLNFAYTGAGPINVFSKVGISFDGGSTWSYGKNPDGYVGTGAGGSGYRCQLATQHGAEGTATGDVQVRVDYYIVGGTDPTGIYGITLEAEAHGVH